MELLKVFPHLNAFLNATSGAFLIFGFYSIMTRRLHAHRLCMLSASVVSVVFLLSYVTHHAIRTYYFGLGPTRFAGQGLARPIYYTILMSHTILAAVIGPFVIATLYRALKGRFDKHRRLARLVYPIWLYVSITGVIVYLMLYQIYAQR
jgi:protein SCO1/2/putative membrane protein